MKALWDGSCVRLAIKSSNSMVSDGANKSPKGSEVRCSEAQKLQQLYPKYLLLELTEVEGEHLIALGMFRYNSYNSSTITNYIF